MAQVEEFSDDVLAFEPLIKDEYATPQTCKIPLTA
jgi:hypothetical protein